MSTMQIAGLGAMDLPTALALLIGAAVCYAAWLTSIVFCAAHGARPLLIASASFSLSASSMASASGSVAGDCIHPVRPRKNLAAGGGNHDCAITDSSQRCGGTTG
jgi:hypothetical protein